MNKSSQILEKITNQTIKNEIEWIPMTSPKAHFFKNPYEHYQHFDKSNSYATKYNDGAFMLVTFVASLITKPGTVTELLLVFVMNGDAEVISKVQEPLFTLRKSIEVNNVNADIRKTLDSFLED